MRQREIEKRGESQRERDKIEESKLHWKREKQREVREEIELERLIL